MRDSEVIDGSSIVLSSTPGNVLQCVHVDVCSGDGNNENLTGH